MRMRLVFALGLLLTIWLTSSVRADYVDSVILIPNADGAFNTFDSSSGDADHWTCVNDSCADANRCDSDTSEKLYGNTGLEQYRLTEAPDTSNGCDSMAIYCNWAEQRSGPSGEWEIMFGWRHKIEGAWYWCVQQEGTDTVIVNGATCTIYRKSWTKAPHVADPEQIPWIRFGGYTDDENEDAAYQPGFNINTAEAGCFLTDCIVTMFDVWVVFYFTVTEAEAGQVIIIGAKDEENYHNPRRGIPPAWE